ncbi:MAG: carbamoyltransferase HypF [Acaryochloris sp. CRU_2_0]|nr:carbamoyltransferase HypF [Acaryochloris sp. CRU_2_0]
MNPSRQRLHLRVQGMVQGVGFRPFVYTLATELGLDGWVRNTDSGVDIEIEGSPSQLTTFLERMECDRPPHALFADLETDWLAPWGDSGFEIQPSALDSPTKSAWILPDLATCPACLREIFDQHNRRYQYPFTNCTHCGPRYSILTAIPYDRPHTTMQGFRLCADCQQEYDNPQDRRFHAQPNACSRCGPHLELWDNRGKALLRNATAPELITLAAHSIRKGRILALKGLGGFHLIVDARNEGAVQVLRERKHRPTKPLAVMYPSLDAIREDCIVSAVEAELLCSPTAPIVLLHRRGDRLAVSLAPHQCTLGAMLPYTPLHHLLLAELRFPVVATSGNRSLEPICIDDQDALSALADIVDVFLVHDRPIARPVDDSVVRIVAERPIVLRRARGYAPHLRSPSKNLPCILAVGSHLKNTVALSVQGHILVSQHLGDLDQAQTVERFQDTIHQFLTLYAAEPVAIACDTHPDYASTRFAHALGQQRGIPVIQVQHHYAHVLSGLVDHTLDPPVLGIVWDGMGYGLDRSLWGGEFLTILDRTGFQRRAHLRSFPLPGGDRAAREPRRAALGLLYAAFGEAAFKLDCPTLQAFPPQELKLLQIMLRNHVNTPRTSSVGRLFDAIASLIGLCHQQTFAGEAAMWLESTLEGIPTDEAYPYQYQQDTAGTLVLDWQPMLTAILKDQEPIGVISAKFHNTLVAMIGAIADHMGIEQVLLTGGCFQNRYLLEAAMQQLQGQGFIPHQHQQIPPNDGGIAVGQLLGASWTLQQSKGEEGQCV